MTPPIMPSAALMQASPSTEATAPGASQVPPTSPSTSFPTSEDSLSPPVGNLARRTLVHGENPGVVPDATDRTFGKYRAVPMQAGDENLPRVDPARLGNGRYGAARAHHITLAKLRDPRSLYWRSLVDSRRHPSNLTGNGRIIESADELWSAFEDYCEFVSENPMIVEKNGKNDEVVRLQAPPIVSKSDFASFCGFTSAALNQWRDPAHSNHREDLADTIELIFETMHGAQVRQAAGREADPAFMKVLLGLAERKETRKVASEETPGSDALKKVFEQLTATAGGAEPVAARAQVAFDDGTAVSVETAPSAPVMPSAAVMPTDSASAGGGENDG